MLGKSWGPVGPIAPDRLRPAGLFIGEIPGNQEDNMPRQERCKTDYPGVYYILGTFSATGKSEKIYYIYYRLGGRQIEEKAGRQFQDGMTPVRAAMIRSERMKGKAPSNRAGAGA